MVTAEVRPEVTAKARPRRSVWRAWLGGILIIATAIGGISIYPQRDYWWGQAQSWYAQLLASQDRATTNTAQIDMPATTVVTLQIEKQAATEIPRYFSGLIKPIRLSDVGFNRIGTLSQVKVARGQVVAQGELLAQLDTRMLAANQRALEAELRVAQAQLSELKAGPRQQRIEAARANVASAEVERDLAKSSYQRVQKLVEHGAISRQDFDEVKSKLASSEELLRAAQQELSELEAGTRSEQIDAQLANIDRLRAALEQLEVHLAESQILAPFPAIVAERFLDEGAIVSPGTPVVQLVESSGAEVWFGLPIAQAQALSPQSVHKIAVADTTMNGTFKCLLPIIDPTTRTQTAIFEIAADQLNHYVFGQIAQLELRLTINEPGFWLPMSALIKGDQGLWSVFVVDNTSSTATLSRREVDILHLDSERVYVRGTLADGESIVANGVQRLTPGQIVSRQHAGLASPATAVPDQGTEARRPNAEIQTK